MTINPDTSFVLSGRIEQDANHAAAGKLITRYGEDDWLWCELHDAEVFCAARNQIHRQTDPVPEATARAAIFRIEREVRRGTFQRRQLDVPASIARALSLSDVHGWKRAHTPLDVWHVAAAWAFGVDRFATFDERQAELAEAAGLILA